MSFRFHFLSFNGQMKQEFLNFHTPKTEIIWNSTTSNKVIAIFNAFSIHTLQYFMSICTTSCYFINLTANSYPDQTIQCQQKANSFLYELTSCWEINLKTANLLLAEIVPSSFKSRLNQAFTVLSSHFCLNAFTLNMAIKQRFKKIWCRNHKTFYIIIYKIILIIHIYKWYKNQYYIFCNK